MTEARGTGVTGRPGSKGPVFLRTGRKKVQRYDGGTTEIKASYQS